MLRGSGDEGGVPHEWFRGSRQGKGKFYHGGSGNVWAIPWPYRSSVPGDTPGMMRISWGDILEMKIMVCSLIKFNKSLTCVAMKPQVMAFWPWSLRRIATCSRTLEKCWNSSRNQRNRKEVDIMEILGIILDWCFKVEGFEWFWFNAKERNPSPATAAFTPCKNWDGSPLQGALQILAPQKKYQRPAASTQNCCIWGCPNLGEAIFWCCRCARVLLCFRAHLLRYWARVRHAQGCQVLLGEDLMGWPTTGWCHFFALSSVSKGDDDHWTYFRCFSQGWWQTKALYNIINYIYTHPTLS